MVIKISDSAIIRIKKIMASDPEIYAFRISVVGGGCSGFSYQFDLIKEKNDNDLIIEKSGARISIDKASVPFIADSTLDFKHSLVEEAFTIENPNATTSCGCGISFSV